MINFGTPTVLSFNTSHNTLDVFINKPEHTTTVLESLAPLLKDVKKAHILLSGGVDSQFWVRVCNYFNIPARATTYLSFWDGSPINTDDYVCAELTAKKYNIEWDVVNINLNELLGQPQLLELAKKYKTASQQLAVHMYFMEQVVNTNETVFMGGECVYMALNNIGNIYANYAGRLEDLNTYKLFFEQHNLQYFKDTFLLTPELHYLFYKESIKVTEQHQVHLDFSSKQAHLLPDTHTVKQHIWESIIPGSIPTLVKSTGFEKLKKYMAVTSGIYNEFDIKYRHYLQQVLAKSSIDHTKTIVKTHNPLVMQELSNSFLDTIESNNSKPIEAYRFDF